MKNKKEYHMVKFDKMTSKFTKKKNLSCSLMPDDAVKRVQNGKRSMITDIVKVGNFHRIFRT